MARQHGIKVVGGYTIECLCGEHFRLACQGHGGRPEHLAVCVGEGDIVAFNDHVAEASAPQADRAATPVTTDRVQAADREIDAIREVLAVARRVANENLSIEYWNDALALAASIDPLALPPAPQAARDGEALAALREAMDQHPAASYLEASIPRRAKVWIVNVLYGPDPIATGTHHDLAEAADRCRAALTESVEAEG